MFTNSVFTTIILSYFSFFLIRPEVRFTAAPCYGCGVFGHIAHRCPNPNTSRQQPCQNPANPAAEGRVHAVKGELQWIGFISSLSCGWVLEADEYSSLDADDAGIQYSFACSGKSLWWHCHHWKRSRSFFTEIFTCKNSCGALVRPRRDLAMGPRIW